MFLAIGLYLRGKLETRAWNQSHGRHVKENPRLIYHSEFSGVYRYELKNRLKLYAGEMILRPNVDALFNFDDVLGSYLGTIPLNIWEHIASLRRILTSASCEEALQL